MPLNINTREVGLERSIEQTVNKVNRRGMSVKLKSSDYTQPLGRITQKADEFNKSLEASNARVIAFGASAAIIGGVSQTFVQLVTQATKVEKILTDINVVLGTSAENLEKFGQDLFSVARNTSQGLETAAEAALEFSRQGLSMEETLSRTNDALILTRLTGIGAAEAVSGLTAAVNGFADAGLTTTEVINKLAAVDVAFAVSAEDLINALARAGAVAQDAGVNFDQLVGAVTSAQQITARGGAVIGNSFKTIFTRVQRSSTLNSLEELGVVVRDLRGDTLPAIDVLTNLAAAYDTLGDTTKAAVAEQVGGVFQINILKAALKDLTRENSLYAKATGISASATNEAQQKNQQLQQTVQSLAAQTSLSIQELASNLGELSLAPGISKILDAFKGLSEGLNSLLGDDSEGIGADFAKGFVKGIGGVLTGPGVILAIGVFAKLFTSALKFGRDSLKDILQITTAKDKEKKIQESILQVLQTNESVARKLKGLSNDKVGQEELILKAIRAQTAELEQQKAIAQSIAPGLRRKGVEPDLTIKKKSGNGGGAAAGFIPNFSSVTPMERQKERGGAMKAGYAPGAVKDMNVKGVGRVIYNNKETVKKFSGMSQPAIMPPSSSKAGNNYKNNFQKQHGFDPYSSSGFIPNFIDRSKIANLSERGATQGERDAATKKLKDFDAKNPTKNFTLNNESERRFVEIYLQNKTSSGSLYLDRLKKINGYSDNQLKDLQALRQHYQQKGSGSVSLNSSSINSDGFVPNFADPKNAYIVPGTNILELPQAKMQVETNVANYKGNKKTGLHKMEAPVRTIAGKMTSYRKELSALEDQTGVNLLSRNILFSSHDNPTGKKEIKASAQGLTDKFSRGTKGKKKPTTKAVGDKYENELHSQKLKSLGYVKTPDQSKVDFVGKGLKPLEAKFNKIEQSNLIAKSIRLYNDKSIPNFLRSKGLIDESQSINKKNFEDSLLTLKQSGVDADSMSLKDQVKLVKDYNLSDGFVPNFAFSAKVEKAKALRDALKNSERFNNLKDLSKYLNLPNSSVHRRIKEHKSKPEKYIDDLGFLRLYDSNKTVKKIVDTNNLSNKEDLINHTNSNQIDNKLSMAYEKDINTYGVQDLNVINTKADQMISKGKYTGKIPSRLSSEDQLSLAEDLKNKKFTSVKDISDKYPVDEKFLKQTLYRGANSGFLSTLGQKKFARYKSDLSTLLSVKKRSSLDKYKPDIVDFNEGLKTQKYTNIDNALSKTGLPKSFFAHSTLPKTNYGELTKNTLLESYGSAREYEAFTHNLNNLRRSSVGGLNESEVRLMHDNLNKNKYASYKAFLTQHNLSRQQAQGLLSTETSNGTFIHAALGGSQEYKRFTSNVQKLEGKSKSNKQGRQFIKGNAFEEYIVEQAFGTPYTANPDPFDLKNIKGKLTNQLQSLFNIGDGKKYDYGDTVWSQETIGHGDAKMLKKILNERLINLNKFKPAQLKENENQKIKSGKTQALKPRQQPQSKQNTAAQNFNFRLSNKAADMIGTPSGKGGSETRSAIVTENNNKLKGQKGPSTYIKPAIGKAIPDGSKIKFTYTKDYISAPPEAIQALEEIKDGQKRPNIAARMAEIKKENNSSLGFIPNFQIAAGKLTDVAGQENKMGGDVANGFVPNFANPLQQAISRERAAGVPKSMIRVDQDRSLQSKSNPKGLAVINTRDEPAGVKQGISRAKKMGVDPKSHGASVGLIPNFAEYENDVSTALDLGAVSEGLIPNYAFKNFGAKIKKPIKSLGNKIGNFFNTSEKQFLKVWQTTNDKVKYLTDLGMDQISAIQTSKMAPRSVYKTIKREANGLIPNFANLTLYRGQNKSRQGIDKPTIGKNMPSFDGVKTPEDVVNIIQNFVKSHVSGVMAGYRDIGDVGNQKPSGATSFSTSKTVANNFAGSIRPGKPIEEGHVLDKTVPEKNVFNKKKMLRILNKGADLKRKHYPKVQEFKKAMASGAIQKWAEKNGGLYLNVYGRRNDRSLLDHYKMEYGRKEYDFYDKTMKQMVPESDIGYNPNGTRQILPGESEVMQVFNKGLIPKSNKRQQNTNEIKFGKFEPSTAISQKIHFNKYGYGASLSYDNMREAAVKKLGKEYEYISYHEKNIADYAKQNKIHLPQKQGGLISNTPLLDMSGAFKKIMNLPASEIQKLNVIKPREKTKSEISIDASDKEANQIRWVKPQTKDGKDWSLKANPSGLKKFREFLVENQVPQSSISKLDQAIAQRGQTTKTVRDQSSKTFKQLGNGRKKMNQAKSDMNYFKNDSNLISTKNLYIPNLKGLIKDYNQNYANVGFVPNFASQNFEQPGQQTSSNTKLSDASNSKNFSSPGSKIPEAQTLDSGTIFSQSQIKKVLLEYDLDSLDQGIMELQAQNVTVPANIIREVHDRKEKQSAFSGQRKRINSLGSNDEALNQAVNREISAGVPRSQIRIEQDNSLRSSQNAKGLAVTNINDEPGGIKQGIARSKKMGVDPKSHGANIGFLPNFAVPLRQPKVFGEGLSRSSGGSDGGGGSEKATQELDKASEGLSMRLMGLTTVTYALESAFADMEGTTGQVVRGLNTVVQGFSQAGLAFDAMKGMGGSLSTFIGDSKLGKKASSVQAAGKGQSLFSKKGAMGKLASGFLNVGKALPVVGAGLALLGPAMDLIKEHTKSAAEQMAKSLGEASSSADAFGASLSAAESLQDTNNKLLDLSNSAQAGTYEGRLQEIQLLGQQSKQQMALTEQVKSLGDTAGVTEEDIILMTSGSAEGLEKLREASLAAQQSLSGLQQVKTWADSLQTKSLFGFGVFGNDKEEDPIMKKLAETNMSRSFNRSGGGDKEKTLAQINKLQNLIQQFNPSANAKAGSSNSPTLKNTSVNSSFTRGSGFSVGSAFTATSNLNQQRNDETIALAKQKGIELETNFLGGVNVGALERSRSINPELSKSVVDSEIDTKSGGAVPRGRKSITEISQAIADDDGFSDEIKGQAKGILDALDKGVDPEGIAELFKALKSNVNDYADEAKNIASNAEELRRVQAATLSLEQEISHSYKTRMMLSDSMNAHLNEKLKLEASLNAAQQSYASNLGGIDKVSGLILKQTRERAAQDRNVTQEERAIRRKAIDQLKEKTTTLLQDKGTSLGKSFLKEPSAKGGGGVDTEKLTQSLNDIGFTEKELGAVQSQFTKLAGKLNDPISSAGAMAVIMDSLNNRLASLVDSGDLEGIKELTTGLMGGGGGKEGSVLNITGQKSEGLVSDISDTVDSAKRDQSNLDKKNEIEQKILTQTQALNLLKNGEVKAVEKALLYLEQQASTIGKNAVLDQQATNRTQSYLLEKQKIQTNALTSGEGLVSLIDGEVITRQAALDLEKRRNVGLLGLIDSEEKLQGIVAAEIANKLGSRASSIGMSAATDTQMKQTVTSEDASSNPQLQQFVGQTGYEAMAGMQTQELTGQMSVLSSQYAANAAAGVYQQEALNEMTKSTIDFKIAMKKVQTKLNAGGFALEGIQGINLQRKQTEGRKQSATAQQGFYEDSGNTVKAAEKQVELAKIAQEQNVELYGKEALFRDTLNVRIAENNLAIEKFSQTLANTSFDAVQSGFKNMVKDMGNAAMRMEDVFMKFAGSIVQKIHDQLIERASMQLTSGIFSALGFNSDSSTGGGLTGVQRNLGGIIHRNKGGGVGYDNNKKVPTMLTSGEYVVRKKIVDRLGQDKLAKMNSSGSLEDIYKMNTGGPVTLSSSGGAPAPIVRLNSGGVATALKRAMGGLVFANAGGWMKEKWDQAKSWTNDNILNPSSNSASMNVARGSGYIAGSMYGAYENREEPEYGGPTAPEDPGKRKLNLSSSLDIDPSGNQMSSRFRANNDYSKKYGDYLLNKHDYDVDQQNQKVKARHAKYSGMVGSIGAGLAMGEIGKFAKTAKAAYDMRGSVGANMKGMFTNDPAQKAALRQEGAQTDLANFKKKGITDYGSWKDKSRGSFDFMSKGYSESSAGKAFKEKHGFAYSGNSFIESENYQHSKALSTSKSIQENLLKASKSMSKNQGPARGSSTLDSSSSKGSYMPFVNSGSPSPAASSGSEQQSMAMSKSIQRSLTKSDQLFSSISKSQNHGSTTAKAPSISFGGMPSMNSRFGDRYGSSFNSGMNTDDFSDGSCSNGACAMPQGFGMSQGGKVVGRGGIDKIGPIMLDQGEYVVKADSVSKIEKNNPGFFDRLNSMNMMNQGGVVTSPSSPTPDSPKSPGGGGGAAGNVTVNITVNSSGDTTSSGGGDSEQAMAGKIKDAVVGVISQEKQTGGSLSGY